MTRVPTLVHGDCLAVLADLPDSSVDAIVCDPPYELTQAKRSKPAPFVDNPYGRSRVGVNGDVKPVGGFMGKEWDGTGIAFKVELWEQAYRVLKPGGHLLAFGGTRTWHRLAVAVEDAGFEMRDSIAWLYGSGFPKSLDVSKAIDKVDASAARLARAREFQSWLRQYVTPQQVNAATGTDMGHHYTTHPTQPAVATVAHLDTLRPLLPEVPEWVEAMCRQRTVESENFKRRAVVGHSDSGQRKESSWNPDGSASGVFRVNDDGFSLTAAHTPDAEKWQGWGTALKPAFEPIVVARKPLTGTVAANVLAHGTGALNIDACRIGSAGGTREVPDGSTGKVRPSTNFAMQAAETVAAGGRWPANVVLDESQATALDQQSGTSRFFYVAKAPKKERPNVDGIAHPTVKPLALMRWLVRLVTPPGGVVLDPFGGSGATAEAAMLEGFGCIIVEREADYLPLIRERVLRNL